MADTSTPLLGVDVEREGEEATPPEVSADVQRDVQGSLYRHPREAIKHLSEHGVKLLGTFKVQVRRVAAYSKSPISTL